MRVDLGAFVAWATVFGWVLAAPGGVLAQVPPYDLLVSSRATNSVKRYDGRTGAFVDDFVPPGGAGLSETQEILVRGDDVFVVGIGTPSVLRFDRRGGPGSSFTSGYLLRGPTKANWGPDGDLYVSQWGSGQTSVAVFDGETGTFVREATPDLDRPMDQAWDAQGTLYVVSFGTRDVRRFDADGSLIDVFVQPDEHLLGPVNLWLDEAGDLIIIDWTGGSIQKYSGADGTHVAQLVSGLTNPEGWDIGPDGRLYVGEWNAHRVRAVDLETGEVGPNFVTGGGLGDPNGLAFLQRPPDFALSAAATSATLVAGSASVSLTLAPLRDVDFEEPIAIRCASSSSAVTCTPSPSTVTLGGAQAVVELRLSRAATAGVPWGFCALLLLVLPALLLRRRAPIRALALAGLVAASGCGSDGTEPVPDPGVNARVTVTAEAGALVRSLTIDVSGG